MTDNTQHTVFRERTTGPSLLALRSKPCVRPVVLHMGRIDQGYQNIDIKEEAGHGSFSRSCWTNSEVTRGAPFRTVRSGTPFRVLTLDSSGDSARLAKEEITSPTDFFSIAAISLAALNTSSSITRVVRMLDTPACHQASYIRCRNWDKCLLLPVFSLSWGGTDWVGYFLCPTFQSQRHK